MRSLWFVAGTAAGVYATRKARQAADALTVDGIHDRLTGWFAGARVLREELRAGIAEKETELQARLALGPDGAGRSLSGRPHLTLTTDRAATETAATDTAWKGDD